MEIIVPSQKPSYQHSNGPSKKEEIKMALAKLAVRRQATIGEAELNIFSDDLMRFDLRDVFSALDKIGMRPRAEHELAFPESGAIVKAVEFAEESRKSRIRLEQFRPEVREALAASAEHRRRLESGEQPERVNVDRMIAEAAQTKALPKRIDVVVEEYPSGPLPVCPHCKMAADLSYDPVALGKLSQFYADKAFRALSRKTEQAQQKESEK